jgi:uncharacterized protein with von Willebrand factor type A (vWA) domain
MPASASPDVASVAARIDAIEEAYEFGLAYAAQGRRGDEAGAGAEMRRFLERSLAALDGLADAAGASAPGDVAVQAFLEVLRDDAAKASAAIRLVLARPAISSQLIDNLNASMHLRALLTDLFLIDECLKGAPRS